MHPINPMNMMAALSWSGGKDSCLALWRAQQSSENVQFLLTALEETAYRVRSHGVSKALICAQGAALGLQNRFIAASWKDYESCFIEQLRVLKSDGVQRAIFGDIDLQAHRDWEEKVCAQVGLHALLPLWNENRMTLVQEFLVAGFKARVVCVDGRFLDESYVGCEFDAAFLARLPVTVDACGENGEFHTFVYDGPNFNHPVQWRSKGKQQYVSPPEYGSQVYYFDVLDTLEV